MTPQEQAARNAALEECIKIAMVEREYATSMQCDPNVSFIYFEGCIVSTGRIIKQIRALKTAPKGKAE